MTRLLVGAALLIAAAVTPNGAQSQEIDPDVQRAADEAHVDVNDLIGAMASTGMDARPYLQSVGELEPPYAPSGRPTGAVPPDWPIGGALGQRIFCIEGIESNHGRYMYNPIPVGREHAQGFLGFLPSTARSVGVTIGNRASEWRGAAQMLAIGRGKEFAGVAWGRC